MLRKLLLHDAAANEWLLFTKPLDVLVARELAEVRGVLEQAGHAAREQRLFAAGFLAYEAAAAFDAACVTREPGPLPLACFGLFREAQTVELPLPRRRPRLPEWSFTGQRDEYLGKIARIRQQIAQGNTYQVNYTIRQRAQGLDDPWEFFLATSADAPYAAFIDCAQFAIVSSSPELFFRLDGEHVECRPMKGTAARGMTAADDREQRDRLRQSEKDRAENVMIADMVRNDLGRVATPASVRATSLYDIEKYRTVWQMTSTITASTKASISEIFAALFPSASVTGAPKVAAMKLIAELEESPRQIYTGTIGFVAPGRRAQFSVAIRTALIDTRTGTGTYGVGGGIVWDSDAGREFQECLDKARVLAAPVPRDSFCLLETMLWRGGEGFVLLQEHLDRLAASAEYFDFRCDREQVEAGLGALAKTLPGAGEARVRLLLHRNGELETSVRPLDARGAGEVLDVALAAAPVDIRNPFLYHKTTQRDVYESAREAAGACDDVLLWNRDGYVTESTIANVIVQRHGELLTPPVSCGLLAGTFRDKLLREREIREKPIKVHELDDAEAIFLVNSVRGWMPCRLLPRPAVTAERR